MKHRSGKRAAVRVLAAMALAMALWALSPLAAAAEGKKGPPPNALTDKDPKAYEGLSDKQIAELKEKGLVILDKPETVQGKQYISAAILFDQDIDTVYDLLTQGWRQEEYLKQLDRSILLKKWDGGDHLDMYVEVMGVEINYRVIGDRDKENYRSSWSLDPDYDNDMKEMTGYWQFYWIDEGHTLARYGTRVEVGKWIPDFVQEFMTKQSLPESLSTQKKWVDSGGTYVKKGYKPPEE